MYVCTCIYVHTCLLPKQLPSIKLCMRNVKFHLRNNWYTSLSSKLQKIIIYVHVQCTYFCRLGNVKKPYTCSHVVYCYSTYIYLHSHDESAKATRGKIYINNICLGKNFFYNSISSLVIQKCHASMVYIAVISGHFATREHVPPVKFIFHLCATMHVQFFFNFQHLGILTNCRKFYPSQRLRTI